MKAMTAAGALLLLMVADVAAAAPQETPAETPPSGVVARVNGEPVFAQDVEQRLSSLHAGATGDTRGGFDVERLMFQVVNDVLIGQEARTLGMDEDEKIRRDVDEYRDRLIVRLLERDEIGNRARATDEEIQRVFQQEYVVVDLRIITAFEKEEAEELLELLKNGADMAELALEHSVDPYRLREGLAEEIPRADLQQSVAALAFSLAPGEIGGPVRTSLGWSILRPERFIEPSAELFAQVEGACRQVATVAKRAILKRELTQAARQQLAVSIDRQVAATVEPERLPDGRLMPKVPDKEAVVARIGDQVVTGDDPRALVARWKGVRNQEAAEAAMPIILNSVVERTLFLAEAVRRGYPDRPDVQRVVYAYETQQLIPVFLDEMVTGKVEITTEEMRAYYEEHKEEFHRPPRVRLGQITAAEEEDAERLAEQLRQGTDLGWLARQHSIDRYKDSGGDRGWYTPHPGVDDFNSDLFAAAVGEVLGPVGEPGEWSVVKVLARDEQGIFTFDEISGNVRSAVHQEKQLAAMTEFLDTLRSRAEIEVDDDALARLSISGEQEKPSHVGSEGGSRGH